MTDADLKAVVRLLVRQAKAGEPWAVRELLDRCAGKPRQSVDLDLGIEAVDMTDDQLIAEARRLGMVDHLPHDLRERLAREEGREKS